MEKVLIQKSYTKWGSEVPYINVRLLNDNMTIDQKAEVIRRITDVMVDVLNKDPNTTFVVIDEINPENWGLAGQSVAKRRKMQQ